ncbi:MAG: protein-L-isoaspartate O-methyltransferase family protein, partial [Sphingomicrobium sp.]
MTVHAPVPDYAAARQAMVDSQLRPQGVNDPAVIAAMSLVPRELFVPESERPLAYADRAIPLGEGRAMPAPEVPGLLLTA